MSTVAPARLHHLALTVTDLPASIDWYSGVFGVRYVMDAPHPGGFAQALADEAMQLMIVLHRHDANEGELFRESRTGLDHPGFVVPTRDDLVTWQEHLEGHGVVRSDTADTPLTQSPIADVDYGSVLVFRDPANSQLELVALPSA